MRGVEAEPPSPTEPPGSGAVEAAPRRRFWDIRTWPRGVLALLVLVGLGLAGWGAWYTRKVVVARTTRVRRTLHLVSNLNHHIRQNTHIDQDGDGVGEFAWLGELGGAQGCRGYGHLLRIGEEHFPSALGRKDARGRATYEGFRYHLALPIAGNRWRLERQKEPPAPVPADADAQEQRFICYAWPAHGNIQATRAYVIDHTSEIRYTKCEVKVYRGDDGPRVSAAFVRGGQGMPTAAEAPSYTGADGNTWTILEK